MEKIDKNNMFEATLADELRADIRNKMSPLYSFLQLAYDERVPIEIREKERLKGIKSIHYILERMKEFE